VTIVVSNVYVWLASPDLAAKNMGQLISLAKAKPRQLAYASTGVGSAAHLGGALIEHQAGVEMLHVPFKNTGIAELMGGQVQLKMEPLGSAVPLIKAGRLRPLAVTSARRLAALPDVPAVAETLPGYEVAGWHGIWVPAGSPTAAVASLQKEFSKAVANSDIRKRLADVGAEPVGSGPDEMKQRIARELAQWTKVIRERNIRAE
jgi:tripartite-type tricarboxylate transporter receptor subunit TctC